jgi:hypothetical protein
MATALGFGKIQGNVSPGIGAIFISAGGQTKSYYITIQ